MPDNPHVVELLKEYRDEALLTRTEAGRIIGKNRDQVAGICERNGIKPWPPIAKEVQRKRYCCFPIGYPGEDGFHLCDRPRTTGHPFLCELHEDETWVPNGKVLQFK